MKKWYYTVFMTAMLVVDSRCGLWSRGGDCLLNGDTMSLHICFVNHTVYVCMFVWAVRKKERKLHTTEMRMLWWTRGKTRLDHVRNVDIWKEAHMYPMAEFLREKRLRRLGHVQRRDEDEATRTILQMTVDGQRNRGRPKLRWRDLVKEDIARSRWRLGWQKTENIEMADPSRHTTKKRMGEVSRLCVRVHVSVCMWACADWYWNVA